VLQLLAGLVEANVSAEALRLSPGVAVFASVAASCYRVVGKIAPLYERFSSFFGFLHHVSK
jgi:hypothetical protein